MYMTDHEFKKVMHKIIKYIVMFIIGLGVFAFIAPMMITAKSNILPIVGITLIVVTALGLLYALKPEVIWIVNKIKGDE